MKPAVVVRSRLARAIRYLDFVPLLFVQLLASGFTPKDGASGRTNAIPESDRNTFNTNP
ncbi:hypothetical protein [Burkholderia sp. Ac-20353]|uniref:hypothetical protein n=1 Tax=Burkholderia sp. Ac-20353 TaxID=2703894 RepID=UPI00197C6DEB|nr:hypothetical protein [Burkholderia sp. Ac-20353]MBN3791079.1 hypothetical protein [Burkholderia sp. Ac-20353]